MRLSFAISLALAGLSVAQFSGLPDCAQTCADQFLAGGIGNCGRDPKCICGDANFIGDISCCLIKFCDPSNQSSAVAFAQQLCTAYQISVPSTVSCRTATASGSGSTATPASNSATATGSGANASATSAAVSTSNAAAPRQTGVAAAGLGAIGGLVAAVAML